MRNVIVTGGTRGLGLGIVRKLVCGDYNVIVVARQMNDRFAATVEEAERTRPSSLHFQAFDLANIEEIPNLVKSLRKDYGPIYGLVNNAALGSDGALALMHNSQIERLIRVNTLSPIVLTKYVVRHMMADGGGRVVNVASIVAFTGYSGLSVYSATKASLVGFTRALAREVAGQGVTVNTVSPGYVQTGMVEAIPAEIRELLDNRRKNACRVRRNPRSQLKRARPSFGRRPFARVPRCDEFSLHCVHSGCARPMPCFRHPRSIPFR